MLASSLNCCLETAYRDMMDTKSRWGKTGGVLGYHLIHSYEPGEVTPEEAQAAGLEFAQRLLGDRYEAVVTTHLDRDHLHCHIVFNSVSFADGKKYENKFKDYFGDIRTVSNEVSQKHGLSVIEPDKKGKHYAEWQAEKQGKPTVRGIIRQDIDRAVSSAFTMKSFFSALEKMGYKVKTGPQVKHTAINPPGSERFVRLSSLGPRYSESEIQDRLQRSRTQEQTLSAPEIKTPVHRYARYRGKTFRTYPRLHGFRALYFRYVYLLRGTSGQKKRPAPFVLRKEVIKLDRTVAQFHFLQENQIDTDSQLVSLLSSLEKELQGLVAQRKALYRRSRRGEDVEQEIQEINERLRPLRKSLAMCSHIAENIPAIREQTRLDIQKSRESQNRNSRKRGVEKWM